MSIAMRMTWTLLLAILHGPVLAGSVPEPVVEARVQTLSKELRCLVCQNETLADSTAPLALDLKQEVREMVRRQLSDEEITDYLVTRYGDFIRYRPAFKPATWVLWTGPFLLLVAGVLALAWSLRRRQLDSPPETLTPAQQTQVQRWLEKE